jgi:HTH-type transcriptional regulator, transcriptional repressor of NAD biosynthesis genes
MTTTGLTLGKFAPLHRGHMAVIDRALAENDHTIVIIYDAPETTPIPLPVRSAWIKKLYPSVEVLESWDGPTQTGDTPEITSLHDAYLKHFLREKSITRFYSSENYGAHVSLALNAIDCRVDQSRSALPISATQIRTNPYQHRAFLHPDVYRDLITRIVFLGAPSTGKTTLARALAQHHNTLWMPEYGREYWETHQVNRRVTPQQILEIAQGHITREDALALDANKFLFVDTDATTTAMFGISYHGQILPQVAALAHSARTRYDLAFLCEDDIPYQDTWDRSGQQSRATFHKQTKADLIQRRIPFIPLTGPLHTRIQKVNATLARFEKYTSLGSLL